MSMRYRMYMNSVIRADTMPKSTIFGVSSLPAASETDMGR